MISPHLSPQPVAPSSPFTRIEIPPRVGIIDTNKTHAGLLARHCEKELGLFVACLEKYGPAGLANACKAKPDILIFSCPAKDTLILNAVSKIQRDQPKLKIVFLVNSVSDYLLHLMGDNYYDGVIGIRETSLDHLGEIILGVLTGIRYVSPEIARRKKSFKTDPNAFSKLLTKREIEVLKAISQAMSDLEIAQKLHCSPHTVLCHRRHVMRKLDVHSTPKLIRYAIEKGFD